MRLMLAPSAVRTPRTRTFIPLLTRAMSAVSMRVTGTPGSRIRSDSPPLNLTLMLLLPFTTTAPVTVALRANKSETQTPSEFRPDGMEG